MPEYRRGKATPYTFTSKSAYTYMAKKNKADAIAAAKNKFVRGARPGYAQLTSAAIKRGKGLRGETKALDHPAFVLAFAAGNNNSLTVSNTQEGSGFWNRIGRKICMSSLQITAWIEIVNAPGVLNAEMLRYIIGYDKQPNGVAATWNQVVQAYDNAGGVTNSATDGINLDNRDRFVILRDRKILMPETAATGIPVSCPFGTAAGSVANGGSDGGAIVKEYIRLGSMEVQYNGTANPAVVAQINTGNLFIVAQGSTGGQYQLNVTSRLRFTDC